MVKLIFEKINFSWSYKHRRLLISGIVCIFTYTNMILLLILHIKILKLLKNQ